MKKYLILTILVFVFSCNQNLEIENNINTGVVEQTETEKFYANMKVTKTGGASFGEIEELRGIPGNTDIDAEKMIIYLKKVNNFPDSISIWGKVSEADTKKIVKIIAEQSQKKDLKKLDLTIPVAYLSEEILESITDIKINGDLQVDFFPINSKDREKKLFIPNKILKKIVEKNNVTKNFFIESFILNDGKDLDKLCRLENDDGTFGSMYKEKVFCGGAYFGVKAKSI
ncbi:hypothetical protein BLD25_01465 [Candidatus Gracilibacteria bacterium GN02-872]|nr:hypothetical protein BLD25_01465 [Candidatus Gracilibacteria bacterium GN02-872]